jgi:hypothetical protein
MLGQGSPICRPDASTRLVALVATIAALAFGSECALAETIEVRLRFGWGANAQSQQKWIGAIAVAGGELSDLQPLGVEADEAAAVRLVENRIVIAPLLRRQSDGCDVTIRAEETANVVVDLRKSPDEPAKPVEFKLSDLAVAKQHTPLDDLGSYVRVERAPGDLLRVQLNRDHLVFNPEESLRLTLRPQVKSLLTAPATLEAKLYRQGSSAVLWQATFACDPQNLSEIPVELTVPKAEGAYRLRITLVERPAGFASRLAPWEKGSELAARNVGFVVVDPVAKLPRLTDEWETVAMIDATSSSWWQRLPHWTQVEKLPGFSTPRPLGNVKPLLSPLGQSLVELPPTSPSDDLAWQAYLLPVKSVGEPHAIEIEVPRTQQQHLAVSIIEPDAAGEVRTFGRDWGVFTADQTTQTVDAKTGVVTHRIVFWPRTKSPAVLIANRSHEHGALYGKIRLQRRTTKAAPNDPAAPAARQRLAAAYIAAPTFADSFGAAGEFDAESGRSIETWQTFLTAANRLAQQLQAAGYNGAVLSIAGEGASLAPVAGLGVSPRFDSGLLAATGEDPIRKDVLEVLLRIFDREGLTLVPAVELASPLPALEAIRRTASAGVPGIDCIGADGQTWHASQRPASATAPHYNILHADVQAELAAIVTRLAERYDAHAAWGGVALQLHGGGYGVTPGIAWGLDDETAAAFAVASQTPLLIDGHERFARRSEQLRGPLLPAWNAWRYQQTTNFYSGVAAQLASRRPDARLILCTEDLFAGASASERLRQAVSGRATLDDARAETGIDLDRLATTPGVSLLRPRRLGAEDSVDASATNLRVNHAPELEQLFVSRVNCGEQLYHVPSELRLATFDAQSPFGAAHTNLTLAAASTAAHEQSTRGIAAALSARDFNLAVSGGTQFPLADGDMHRDAMRLFQELPAAGGDTRTERKQPVTLRIYREAESTTLCVVNESAWPLELTIPVEASGTMVWRRLGVDPTLEASQAASDPTISGTLPNGAKTWTTILAPHGVQARRFSSPAMKVGAWTVKMSPAAKAELARRLAEFEQRMAALDFERVYSELQNPDFELTGEAGQMLGWQPRIGSAGVVDLAPETEPVTGHSLHLHSEDALGVAVQSHLFPIPPTGQLTVRARIHGAKGAAKSQLYAWFEYEAAGVTRQRYVAIGGEQSVNPQWTDYEFAVDDLPLASTGQMRLQFHLVGHGDAWIDDVRLYDLRFSKEQRYQISKRLYAAKSALDEGQLMDCQRLIDGYWPRLFVEQAPIASIATKPNDVLPTPAAGSSAEEQRGLSDRLRGIVPRILR